MLGDELPRQPKMLAIDEQSIRLLGLDFSPSNIDAFYAIRGSRAITSYSSRFREVAFSIPASANQEVAFVDLMAEAMDDADVAKHAAKAFDSAGAIMNVVGLIPVVGSLASAAGIGSAIGEKVAERKQESHEWFLIGNKMREVEIRHLLSRRKT